MKTLNANTLNATVTIASVFLAAAAHATPIRVRPAFTRTQQPIQHNIQTTQAIRSNIASMRRTILGAATPPIEIIARPGITLRTLRWSSYHPSVIPQVEVKGVGADGHLDVTLLAPVSGHTGVDDARRWATTDTFTISYQHGNGPRTTIARDVKSIDLVTDIDVTVPLKQGELTKLYYDRSGSAGVWGFPSGRTIELMWNGT